MASQLFTVTLTIDRPVVGKDTSSNPEIERLVRRAMASVPSLNIVSVQCDKRIADLKGDQ